MESAIKAAEGCFSMAAHEKLLSIPCRLFVNALYTGSVLAQRQMACSYPNVGCNENALGGVFEADNKGRVILRWKPEW